jgi:predicted alpha/beta-fold hydrolase
MAAHLRRAVSLHDVSHLEKVDWPATQQARSVREFDRAFTVRMFGYRSTDHYYRDASSAQFLHQVSFPVFSDFHAFL